MKIIEDIKIPLNPGDAFKFGKWKNKTAIYASSYVNEKGDLIFVTDNGKEIPAMKVRMMTEALKMSDFKKHSGTSGFTEPFRKDRQKLKGTGAKSAKYFSMKVNRKKDYVTFVFKSKPTYKKNVKAVSTPAMNLRPARIYTEQIRILDFFKWADTKPGMKINELSFKEVKEILNVADIQVFCDCPSFHWQGINYVVSLFDASIFPTNIVPKHWDKFHNDDSFACKHLDILMSSGLNIYINNMTSALNSYLKKHFK